VHRPVRDEAARLFLGRRLLEVIGRKDLIGDPRFDTAAARLKQEPEVDAMITAWTRQHDKREAMRVLGAAGVPAGAIFDTMCGVYS
jgi:formyl-CoA transferase